MATLAHNELKIPEPDQLFSLNSKKIVPRNIDIVSSFIINSAIIFMREKGKSFDIYSPLDEGPTKVHNYLYDVGRDFYSKRVELIEAGENSTEAYLKAEKLSNVLILNASIKPAERLYRSGGTPIINVMETSNQGVHRPIDDMVRLEMLKELGILVLPPEQNFISV